jgi:hypothetical protein
MAGRHAHHRGGGAARAGRDLRDGRPVQHRDGGNSWGGDNNRGGDNDRGHDGGRGVTEALLPANGFISNPSRTQGGHLW